MLEKKADTGPEKDEREEASCTKKVKAHSNNEKDIEMLDIYIYIHANKTVEEGNDVNIQRW